MVPTRRLLDEAMPHWDVREQHARDVAAPVGDVWAALLSMPVRDLPVAPVSMRTPLRAATSLRPESVVELRQVLPDGWVRIAMDVRLEPTGIGTTLRTETRVLATGPRAKRAFAVYWRVVSGGSSLIRHELLRAVARRAEADRARHG